MGGKDQCRKGLGGFGSGLDRVVRQRMEWIYDGSPFTPYFTKRMSMEQDSRLSRERYGKIYCSMLGFILNA